MPSKNDGPQLATGDRPDANSATIATTIVARRVDDRRVPPTRARLHAPGEQPCHITVRIKVDPVSGCRLSTGLHPSGYRDGPELLARFA